MWLSGKAVVQRAKDLDFSYRHRRKTRQNLISSTRKMETGGLLKRKIWSIRGDPQKTKQEERN